MGRSPLIPNSGLIYTELLLIKACAKSLMGPILWVMTPGISPGTGHNESNLVAHPYQVSVRFLYPSLMHLKGTSTQRHSKEQTL